MLQVLRHTPAADGGPGAMEWVEIADPATEESLAARLSAITEALAESGDAKLAAVADAIVTKGGAPVRVPDEKIGLMRRMVNAVTAPFRG